MSNVGGGSGLFREMPLQFFDEYGRPSQVLVCEALNGRSCCSICAPSQGFPRFRNDGPFFRTKVITGLQKLLDAECGRGAITQHDRDILHSALESEKSCCCMTPTTAPVFMVFWVVMAGAMYGFVSYFVSSTEGDYPAAWSAVGVCALFACVSMTAVMRRCCWHAWLRRQESNHEGAMSLV